MRQRIVAEILSATGVLLLAGAALAQTAGPSVGPPSPSIVPVTGPSTGPGPLETGKPELVSVPPRTSGKVEGSRGEAPPPALSGRAPRQVKVAPKTVVKKAPAPKRATTVAGPAKPKHVAKAKPRLPEAQPVVAKPLRPPKGQAPAPTAKGAAPVPAVLPRV